MRQFSKVFVFDIDGTLIHRTVNKIKNVKHEFQSNGRYIYLRPQLHHLAFHLDKIKQYSKVILWTSMQRKNAQKIAGQFQTRFLKFQSLYCQQHCGENLSKDLNVIARDFNLPVENVYLIDDSPHKQVKNQNFIHIQQYDGLNFEDKQIIRIIQVIYKILELKFQQNLIQQAEIFGLTNNMHKLLKYKQNNDNQYQKQQLNQKQVASYKNQNKQQKTKYQQKTSMIKDNNNIKKQKEKIQRPKQNTKNIKFQKLKCNQLVYKQKFNFYNQGQKIISPDPEFKIKSFMKPSYKIKSIVFDINQTLLVRTHNKIEGIQPDGHNKNYHIYLRPHLQDLIKFLSQVQLNVFLWSTIRSYNCQIFSKLLIEKGFKFKKLYSGQNLVDGIKNLQIIQKQFQIPMQSIVLIDDNQKKRVFGQNFIQISSFTGENRQDDSILYLIKELGLHI